MIPGCRIHLRLFRTLPTREMTRLDNHMIYNTWQHSPRPFTPPVLTLLSAPGYLPSGPPLERRP